MYVCGWGPYPPTPFPYLSPNRLPSPLPGSRKYPISPTSSTSNECDQRTIREYISLYRDFKHASQMELMDLISSSGGDVDTSVSEGRQFTRMTNLDYSSVPQSEKNSPESPQGEEVEHQINEIIEPYVSRIFTRLVEDFLKSFEEMTKGLILLKATGITLDDICSSRDRNVCVCRAQNNGSSDIDEIPLKPYDASEFEQLLRNALKRQFRADRDQLSKRANMLRQRASENAFNNKKNLACECEQAAKNNNPFINYLTEINGPKDAVGPDKEDCDTILRKEKKKFLINCLKLLQKNESFRSCSQSSLTSDDFNTFDSEINSPVFQEFNKAKINIDLSANIYNLTVCHVQYATLSFFRSHLAHRAEPQTRIKRILPPIPDTNRYDNGIERVRQSKNEIEKTLVKCMKSPSGSSRNDVFISEALTKNDDSQNSDTSEHFPSKYMVADKGAQSVWPTLKYEDEVRNRIRQYKLNINRRHSQYEQFERRYTHDTVSEYKKYPGLEQSGSKRHTYYGYDATHVAARPHSLERKYATKIGHIYRPNAERLNHDQYELERCQTRITELNEGMRKTRNLPMNIAPQVPYTSHLEDRTLRHSYHDYAPRKSEIAYQRVRFKSEPNEHRSKLAYEITRTRKAMSEPEEPYNRHILYEDDLFDETANATTIFEPTKYNYTGDIPIQIRTKVTAHAYGSAKMTENEPKRRLSYTYTNNLPNHKHITRTYSLPVLVQKCVTGERRGAKENSRLTEASNFKDAVTNILNIWTYEMIAFEKGANSPRVRSQILNRRKKIVATIREKLHYHHILSVFKRIESNESPILEFKHSAPTKTPKRERMRRTSSCHAELKYITDTHRPKSEYISSIYKHDVSTQIKAWKHELLALEEEAKSPYLKTETIRRYNKKNSISLHLEPKNRAAISRRPRSESLEYNITPEIIEMKRPHSLHSEPISAVASAHRSKLDSHEDDMSYQINAWKQELSELEDSVGSPYFIPIASNRKSMTRARSLQSEPKYTHNPRSTTEFAQKDLTTGRNIWRDESLELESGVRNSNVKADTHNRKNMARAKSLQSDSKHITPLPFRTECESMEYNKKDLLTKMDTWKQEILELESSVESPNMNAGSLNRKNLTRASSLQSEPRHTAPPTLRSKSDSVGYNRDFLTKIDTWKQDLLDLEKDATSPLLRDQATRRNMAKSYSLCSEVEHSPVILRNKDSLSRRKMPIPTHKSLDHSIKPRALPTQFKVERRYSAKPRQLPAIPTQDDPSTRRHSQYETSGNFVNLLADRRATLLSTHSEASDRPEQLLEQLKQSNATQTSVRSCSPYPNEMTPTRSRFYSQ